VPTRRGAAQHAAVRCDAGERQRLEQLCRTITRPAVANERVQINSAGQVVLKLKTAWRDGTTHIVMSPLQFMQRLAALVPRPRLHLIRLHGVLAPNAKLRALVVPHGPEEVTGKSELTATEPGCTHSRPARIGWVRLLTRVFEIDLEHCPNCGGQQHACSWVYPPASPTLASLFSARLPESTECLVVRQADEPHRGDPLAPGKAKPVESL